MVLHRFLRKDVHGRSGVVVFAPPDIFGLGFKLFIWLLFKKATSVMVARRTLVKRKDFCTVNIKAAAQFKSLLGLHLRSTAITID